MILYETFSREDLLGGTWLSEGTILGAAGQDWTPVAVAVGNRTNNFFWARSWIDSDGSGLPDWWQLKYFGQIGVDPYGNPAMAGAICKSFRTGGIQISPTRHLCRKV